MKRAVYIVGYPGSGKSTLFSGLTSQYDAEPVVLHQGETTVLGKRRDVFLRGERLDPGGVTIGRTAGPFPGVDGMQRNSTPLARDWVTNLFPKGDADWLLLEGSLLATKGFLTAAHESTRLTLLHVTCEASEQRARQRAELLGTDYQKDAWRKGKITQTDNIVRWAREAGLDVAEIDNDIDNHTADLVEALEELLYA